MVETGNLYKALFGVSTHKIIRRVLVEEGITKYLATTEYHASIAGLFKLEFQAKKDCINWQVLECRKLYALNLKRDNILDNL